MHSGIAKSASTETLKLRDVTIMFGAFKAIDGVSLTIEPNTIHGLIGPNGSGKTTTLNAISGFVGLSGGTIEIGGVRLGKEASNNAAACGIGRTFQTPRVMGKATVLENVLIGGVLRSKTSFLDVMLALPKAWRDERKMRNEAMAALAAVGLADLADVKADRLQHSELRFMELARALFQRPKFMLVDEPASGLASDEIEVLGRLMQQIVATMSVGIVLVEHHAEFVLDICNKVTVLNIGKVLAEGTPSEIRNNREVIDAYLGA